MTAPAFLYHCTTPAKAKRYRECGCIKLPVRGFDTLLAAMAWCVKTGRTVIYRVDCDLTALHKLPDHHNEFGSAWWLDADVPVSNIKCVFSA